MPQRKEFVRDRPFVGPFGTSVAWALSGSTGADDGGKTTPGRPTLLSPPRQLPSASELMARATHPVRWPLGERSEGVLASTLHQSSRSTAKNCGGRRVTSQRPLYRMTRRGRISLGEHSGVPGVACMPSA